MFKCDILYLVNAVFLSKIHKRYKKIDKFCRKIHIFAYYNMPESIYSNAYNAFMMH